MRAGRERRREIRKEKRDKNAITGCQGTTFAIVLLHAPILYYYFLSDSVGSDNSSIFSYVTATQRSLNVNTGSCRPSNSLATLEKGQRTRKHLKPRFFSAVSNPYPTKKNGNRNLVVSILPTKVGALVPQKGPLVLQKGPLVIYFFFAK